MGTEPKWKQFEQLVAAIHYTETQGAVVRWNDIIDGRQFDVTVRFKHGLHSYLTVIECKDKGKKVPVTEVDALVTKYRDVKADKAVMVSARGYQSGCMPVAERHNIKLLTLCETSSPQFGSLLRQLVPALLIHDVRLVRTEGKPDYELPEDDGKLQYLMNHITLKSGHIQVTPEHLLEHWLNVGLTEKATRHRVMLDFERTFEATVPYEAPFQVAGMRFAIDFTEVPEVAGQLVTPDKQYELRNTTGEIEHVVNFRDLQFGFMTEMKAGRFYRDPTMPANYYCDSIDDRLMRLVMVESYQHGLKMGAVFTAELEHQRRYVEISDPTVIQSLKLMLSEMKVKLSTQPML